MVVVSAPRSPIPSPTTPSPGTIVYNQRTDSDSNTEREGRSGDNRAGSGANVDHGRVILRHIDDGRARGLDYIDCLTRRLLHFYFLLLAAAQRPGVVGLSAQPLNRCSDRVLISQERLPYRGVIVNVIGHHGNDGRKIHQCNEGGIESLFFRRVGKRGPRQTRIGFHPGMDILDFLRIRRRRSDLGEQRIRIKRDRRQ